MSTITLTSDLFRTEHGTERTITLGFPGTPGVSGAGGGGVALTARVVFPANVVDRTAVPKSHAGVTLAVGDQVLLVAQTTTSQNWRYTVSADAGATVSLTRNLETIDVGTLIVITEGNNLENGNVYVCLSTTAFEPHGVANDLIVAQHGTIIAIGQDVTSGGTDCRDIVWNHRPATFAAGAVNQVIASFDCASMGIGVGGALTFAPNIRVRWNNGKLVWGTLQMIGKPSLTAPTIYTQASTIKGLGDLASVAASWTVSGTVFQLRATNNEPGIAGVISCQLGWYLDS